MSFKIRQVVFSILLVALISSTKVLAQDVCKDVLMSDRKFIGFSIEAQHIILMASFIATASQSQSQIKPATQSPRIDPHHIFLAALIEVIHIIGDDVYDVYIADNNPFIRQFLDHQENNTLIATLRQLGILEDFQTFLLTDSDSNSRLFPFLAVHNDGRLALRLNKEQVSNFFPEITYTETTNRLFDESHKARREEVKYMHNTVRGRIGQNEENIITHSFSEHFLLGILGMDHPIRQFLLHRLNRNFAIEVRYMLYSLINAVRNKRVLEATQAFQRPSHGNMLLGENYFFPDKPTGAFRQAFDEGGF